MYEQNFKKIAESPHIEKENKLYHYTSISSLFKILNSGYLLPKKYKLNTGSDSEIAVTRKSTEIDSIENVEVRITLYRDKISTLRGVRIKPINEAYLEQYQDYRDSLRKFIKNSRYSGFEEKIYKHQEDLLNEENPDIAIKLIAHICNIPSSDMITNRLEDFLLNLDSLVQIKTKKIGNQFEERIQTVEGIPVDEKYMTIDFMKTIKTMSLFSDEDSQSWITLIEDNKNLFNKNEKFTSFLASINDTNTISVIEKKDLSKYSDSFLKGKYSDMFTTK